MTPQEILNEIYRLPFSEQKQISDSLSEQLSEDSIELRLQQALFEKGLLREIKTSRRSKLGNFKPIKIKGKPLSETLIEERR